MESQKYVLRLRCQLPEITKKKKNSPPTFLGPGRRREQERFIFMECCSRGGLFHPTGAIMFKDGNTRTVLASTGHRHKCSVTFWYGSTVLNPGDKLSLSSQVFVGNLELEKVSVSKPLVLCSLRRSSQESFHLIYDCGVTSQPASAVPVRCFDAAARHLLVYTEYMTTRFCLFIFHSQAFFCCCCWNNIKS